MSTAPACLRLRPPAAGAGISMTASSTLKAACAAGGRQQAGGLRHPRCKLSPGCSHLVWLFGAAAMRLGPRCCAVFDDQRVIVVAGVLAACTRTLRRRWRPCGLHAHAWRHGAPRLCAGHSTHGMAHIHAFRLLQADTHAACKPAWCSLAVLLLCKAGDGRFRPARWHGTCCSHPCPAAPAVTLIQSGTVCAVQPAQLCCAAHSCKWRKLLPHMSDQKAGGAHQEYRYCGSRTKYTSSDG